VNRRIESDSSIPQVRGFRMHQKTELFERTPQIHAAVATAFEIDALISWNLKHLANLRKMEMINGVNLKEGYTKKLELITPMEASDE
jgi:hypothetical protein